METAIAVDPMCKIMKHYVEVKINQTEVSR